MAYIHEDPREEHKDNRYYCIDADDPILPSQVPSEPRCNWLSYTPELDLDNKYKEPGKTGKWMIFTNYADEFWPKLLKATHNGSLGVAVKAAANHRGNLMCIYTRDYDDEKDIKRVLNGIRDLQIIQSLSYKRDIDTLEGKRGAIWYSPAGTRIMRRPSTYR
jgi:Domain of unknown function (DUF1917)